MHWLKELPRLRSSSSSSSSQQQACRSPQRMVRMSCSCMPSHTQEQSPAQQHTPLIHFCQHEW